MPAGGRRPGAGAPKGNTNALKSGRHSARFKAVLTAMSQVPEVRDYFALVRRRQLRSERLAAAVCARPCWSSCRVLPPKTILSSPI